MSNYPPYTPLPAYHPMHINSAISSLTGVGRCFAAAVSLGSVITPGVNTVALTSVGGLYQGQRLNINQGSGNPYEDVTILQVDPVAKTFTAQFANGYSTSINVVSRIGCYTPGLIVNKAGSTVTFTLANGSPLLYPLPTDPEFGTFAVVDFSASNPLAWPLYCEYGLFVSVTGTTIGDYTLAYRNAVV